MRGISDSQVSLCTLGWHHSIHIRTVTSQPLLSALLNLCKLLDEWFGQGNMHHTLIFLPRPATKESSNVLKIIAELLISNTSHSAYVATLTETRS